MSDLMAWQAPRLAFFYLINRLQNQKVAYKKQGRGNGRADRAGQHAYRMGRRNRNGRRPGVTCRRFPAEGGREIAGPADIWSIRKGACLSAGLPERLAEHDRQSP